MRKPLKTNEAIAEPGNNDPAIISYPAKKFIKETENLRWKMIFLTRHGVFLTRKMIFHVGSGENLVGKTFPCVVIEANLVENRTNAIKRMVRLTTIQAELGA